jgi:hypothetical protein
MAEWRNVRLAEELCLKVEKQFGDRFTSLDSLLTAVLQELLGDNIARLDQAELQIIEQRLKDLGYL